MNLTVPTEEEFLDQLGATLLGRPDTAETIFTYRLEDGMGYAALLSFDVVAASIQVTISHAGVVLSSVSAEGAVSMRLIGRSLEAQFDFRTARSEMRLAIEPRLALSWSTLCAR